MGVTQADIGKLVMSRDAGNKMIRSVSVPHGPYRLLKITRVGMAILEGRENPVPLSLLELANEPATDPIPIEFLQNLQRLDIQDGDLVVMTIPENLPAITIELIRHEWERVVQKHLKIQAELIILDSGFQLGIIRKG